MPAGALGLALGAAVVHAAWNVLLARAREPQAATAVAFALAVVIWAPVAAARWRVEGGAWPYVAGSAALESAYVVLLGAALGGARLSVFYPLARGLAPVLVLAVAVVALGASTSWRQAVGVCAVGAGVLLVRGRRPDPASTAYGLAIAATIAGYTIVDNSGVTRADPLAYVELVMIPPAVLSLAFVAARRGRSAVAAALRWETALVAPLTLAPYALVLYALRLAPAAPVAAVRETSVLLVTALAAVVLKEHVSAWRAAGAAAVVVGVALLAV
ncbi:MAG TPA: EamA family transporter [Gaiellaceae bacterium]|nr:EamA family transporter [Gaiellaceae bacterium]